MGAEAWEQEHGSRHIGAGDLEQECLIILMGAKTWDKEPGSRSAGSGARDQERGNQSFVAGLRRRSARTGMWERKCWSKCVGSEVWEQESESNRMGEGAWEHEQGSWSVRALARNKRLGAEKLKKILVAEGWGQQ